MKSYWRVLLLAPILLIGACLTYAVLAIKRDSVQTTATAEIEASLTIQHGAEVRAAIENFEKNWLSLEAHTNPNIQSEFATGPYLDYWGNARQGDKIYSQPSWLITRSATVTYLRVIEYAPERFKAVANVEQVTDEITPRGEFIKSLPRIEFCRLYLFVEAGSTWKVADLFDMTIERDIERDWENELAWEKKFLGQQIMGDLPQEKCLHME